MKRTPYTRRLMLNNLNSKGLGLGWKATAKSDLIFYGASFVFTVAMGFVIWQLLFIK